MDEVTKSVEVPQCEPASAASGRLARSRLLTRICLPRKMKLSLPGLGVLVVETSFLGYEAALPWIRDSVRSCELIPLECGASSGALVVERGLALGLVNAVLGHPMPVVARCLSRIERGIFEGAIVALLSRLAFPPAIRLGAGEELGTDLAPFSVGIAVEMRGLAGQARLCGTSEFFERVWTTLGAAPEPGQVLATLRVELAQTRLLRSELDAVSVGDAIVFEKVAAVSPSESWPVQVRLGDIVAPARAYPDGAVCIEDSVAGESREGTETGVEESEASGACLSAELATAPIQASSSVEITAEIGSIPVRDGDRATLLRRLRAGSERTHRVHLRIDHSPWADGEILAIGDEFGVRVTRKLAG
jgi:hypothetical protein